MEEWNDPFNIIGFIGGVVLAASLLPQIYLAYTRKSTADISFLWQAVYIVGLVTLMIYYAHFKLWAVFYPMAFEFTCIMYLTGLKIYYEVIRKKSAPDLPTATDFEMSRSGGIRRIPSKLALEVISEASKSGRVGRVLSDASRSGRESRAVSSSSASVVDDKGYTGVTKQRSSVGKPAVASIFRDKVIKSDSLSDLV